MKIAFWVVLAIIVFIGVNHLVWATGFHRKEGHYISVAIMVALAWGFYRYKGK